LRGDFGTHHVWFDDRIRFGDDFWQVILDAIASCDVFLFLVSDDSLASSYCMGELMEAYRLQKSIIPVFVRDTTQTLPQPLSKLDFCDMKNGIRKNIYDELVQSINAYSRSIPAKEELIPLSSQPTPFPGYPIEIDNRGGMIGGSNNTINNGLSSWVIVLIVLALILAILILG
jgi:predicted DNA-binding protein YlxM (UPF0122 family)